MKLTKPKPSLAPLAAPKKVIVVKPSSISHFLPSMPVKMEPMLAKAKGFLFGNKVKPIARTDSRGKILAGLFLGNKLVLTPE